MIHQASIQMYERPKDLVRNSASRSVAEKLSRGPELLHKPVMFVLFNTKGEAPPPAIA